MTRTIGAIAVSNYEDYCMFFPRFYFLFWQRVGYKKIEETFFFFKSGCAVVCCVSWRFYGVHICVA